MAIIPSALRIRRPRPSSSSGGQISTSMPSSTEKSRPDVTKADIKRSTRLRKGCIYFASFCYLISFVFLVLILIGNTHDRPVLRQIYFYQLDLSQIIPLSAPNAVLINSIAQTLGLHDFYQIGLWNFCEGYNNVGITYCSTPQSLYWFNPVSVLTNELLAGATIALPTQVITVLTILRLASQIMFGFFLTACILTFLLIFLSPLVLNSRWYSLPFSLLSFVTAVLALAASVIGSVMALVFKYAAESQSELNIRAYVGTRMLVFEWIATGFAVAAFLVHAGLGCCCTSRRDVVTGRRPVKGEREGGSGEREVMSETETATARS